ncbi:anaphase-promoting complex, cyclosome, subunit 4-domain-containing protein [Syncephalis pseudoplumigaleata]|uniref:Anaphase-promoting complex subunit 4 n=1 Tax=Syncephalis pseudoplumigaleata TaxID=1712513 RepID=A0A4P9YXV7_9FUNG|nr:anaphase-promoting complex, cyclosome, subunit 4-domain-containing protein [Syncephalis pseudoplumigaleata]|eukprot:RKP24864.1 anaphase-promoting complex, cyclosome, subunit 4-domain-containing protein [Syncephalis pseudoplumigaleata]
MHLGWSTLPTDLDPYEPQSYGLLAIVDAGGWTRLSINGLLDIGVVGYDRPQDVMGVHIDEESLSYLLLLTARTTTTTTNTGRLIELQQFSLPYIGRYANELAVIESMATSTSRLLNEMHEACRLLKTEYHAYRQSIDEQVRVLASLLWRHGDDSTPRDAFLYFMASLSVTGAFEQFFEQNLTEHDIKRWRATGQKSLGAMQEAVKEVLHPSVEQLRQIIHKVQTFTHCPLGFRSKDIEHGLVAVDRFVSLVTQLSVELDHEIECFNEFTTWLSFASGTLAAGKHYKEHRPIRFKQELVQGFLKRSLAGEQYRSAANGAAGDDSDNDDGDDPFREVKRGTDQLYAYFHKTSTGRVKLSGGFHKITELMRKIFSSSMDTINNNIKLTSTLTIARTREDAQPCSAMRIINDKPTQSTIDANIQMPTTNAVLANAMDTITAVQVARIPLAVCTSSAATMASDARHRLRVLDMHFFDDDTLCLRVELAKDKHREYPIEHRRERAWLRQYVRRLAAAGLRNSLLTTQPDWFLAYCRRRNAEKNMLRNRWLERSITSRITVESSDRGSLTTFNYRDGLWMVMAADARRTLLYHSERHSLYVLRADMASTKQAMTMSPSLFANAHLYELAWPMAPQYVTNAIMDDAFLVAECHSDDRRQSWLCVWSRGAPFVISGPGMVISLVMLCGDWLLARIPYTSDPTHTWSCLQMYNLRVRQWCPGSIILRPYQRPSLLDMDEEAAYVHVCFTKGIDTTVQWQMWRFSLRDPMRCFDSGTFPRPIVPIAATSSNVSSSSNNNGNVRAREESAIAGISYCYSESYSNNAVVYDIAVFTSTPYHILALQHIGHASRSRERDPVVWRLAMTGTIDLVEAIDYIAPLLGSAFVLVHRHDASHRVYNAYTGETCLPWASSSRDFIVRYKSLLLSSTHLVTIRANDLTVLDYLPLDKKCKRISTLLGYMSDRDEQ